MRIVVAHSFVVFGCAFLICGNYGNGGQQDHRCGNGIVEDGEQCECNAEVCSHSCCDPATCRILESCLGECSNGVKNFHETDVDCGGDLCPPCNQSKVCLQDSDCAQSESQTLKCRIVHSQSYGICGVRKYENVTRSPLYEKLKILVQERPFLYSFLLAGLATGVCASLILCLWQFHIRNKKLMEAKSPTAVVCVVPHRQQTARKPSELQANSQPDVLLQWYCPSCGSLNSGLARNCKTCSCLNPVDHRVRSPVADLAVHEIERRRYLEKSGVESHSDTFSVAI